MTATAKPLVILAGPIHPDGHSLLETEARVTVCPDLTEDGVIAAAREAEGILFRIRPKCSERLMTACKRLKVVGRHGVGLDTVDLPAATRLGIAVVHAPGSNSDAVAEHAVMLMLAAAKKTTAIDRLTRRGQWIEGRARGIFELKGKTLGVIGVGNIGRRVAHIARAFGMRILGHDPYVAPDELRAREAEPTSLDQLLAQSDVITVHTPLTPETRHLINAQTIAKMKPGVVFVNTCRGGTQDERALFEGLSRGTIKAAGLDVWEEEPTPVDNPLLNLENVVCTSHIAGVSDEANRTMAVMVADEMLRVLRGEKPKVLGNPDLWPRLAHLR
jgi:D-3-phosphoglycerate dehydrogenase / 2-oxoglutarate reductase